MSNHPCSDDYWEDFSRTPLKKAITRENATKHVQPTK
nr:MAG TPA: hypothetical protein [Caudoviricetes sp.]